ncbi:MAG: ferrous iron transport protein A [Deltaproteobacteria bacterium]|jgi:ferrous iron transport protein A|nr:ferrous iron transport protein A [Deltaproteobacteria bacterium]
MTADVSKNTMPLRKLKRGQMGVITGITADGEMGRRIRDMGLIPGVQVKCMGHAPLKDPMAMRLMGFTLTLRNNEADFITVAA